MRVNVFTIALVALLVTACASNTDGYWAEATEQCNETWDVESQFDLWNNCVITRHNYLEKTGNQTAAQGQSSWYSNWVSYRNQQRDQYKGQCMNGGGQWNYAQARCDARGAGSGSSTVQCKKFGDVSFNAPIYTFEGKCPIGYEPL